MNGTVLSSRALLSAYEPSVGERVLAIGVAVVSVFLLGALAPFAKESLPPVAGFLPVYQSLVVLCDAVTAALFFREFRLLGTRPLLILGGAYVFSAAMAVEHALSFPGLFAPSGLLGSGPQTTVWLYFIWHLGFPAALIAYSLEAGKAPAAVPRRDAGKAVAVAAVTGCLAAVAAMFLCTTGEPLLPTLMQGNGDLPAKYAVAAFNCAVIFAGLVLLGRRAGRSAIDLWLMVVGLAWLCDVALAAVFNAGRYSLGWYAGRVYGLLAAAFVLGVLAWRAGGLRHAPAAR